MGQFVTPAGFIKKTLPEIKLEIEDDARAVWGEGADLDPDGDLGNFIMLQARRDAQLWDLAEEVYQSKVPTLSTGINLARIAEGLGVLQNPAAPTTVLGVLLYGTAGTPIPAGSRLRTPTGESYTLDSAVTLATGTFGEVVLDLTPGSTTYAVSLDGTTHTATVLTTDSKETIIAALITQISTVAKWEALSVAGPKLQIRPNLGETAGNLGTLTNVTLSKLGGFGNFTGDTAGAISCPIGALTEIVTGISGWDSAYNRTSGLIGSDLESDDALRLRLFQSFRGGLATESAILRTIRDDVEGLVSVSIRSNRTWAYLADGMPPKSYEVIAVGGTDQAIAEAIWRAGGAGIEMWGAVVSTVDGLPGIAVIDSEGNTQRVFFSRPIPKYIWVRAKVRLSTEEAYPVEWAESIRTAILDLAGSEIRPGRDVVYQNLFKAIYRVQGLDFVDLDIGVSNSSSDLAPDRWMKPVYTLGTWVDDKIPMAGREYAEFDTIRISVEELS